MIKRVISTVVAFLVSNMGWAVEVQPGVLYQSGTLIESSDVGASFTIPQGWQGAWPNGSQFFILESQALQASLFMLFDTISQQQLVQLMSNPIPLDTGISLQPLAKPESKNGQIEARYSVVGAPQAMSAFVSGREVRPGLSVAIIALTTSSNNTVFQTTSQIVGSIKSKPVQATPATTTAHTTSSANAGGQSWQEYMRGRYIARYYTGSGYSEKEELWLCSDGTFHSSFNSGGYSMNGASGASQSGGRGQWRAEGNIGGSGVLILQFGAGKVVTGSGPGFDWSEQSSGGERWTYQLTLGDSLYLDNNKWLRGNNDYCR